MSIEEYALVGVGIALILAGLAAIFLGILAR